MVPTWICKGTHRSQGTISAFQKASQKLHLYSGRGHTNYPNIKFPCFCWELQVCMVSCQCQVLIGCEWHNRNFWDRIGLTLDIVTRAWHQASLPKPNMLTTFRMRLTLNTVPFVSKLSNQLFLVYLAVLIIISPVAMIWFHNIIMNPL